MLEVFPAGPVVCITFRIQIIIIIKLPDQAIASTPSAPRPPPPGRKKEGAPLHYVGNYYALNCDDDDDALNCV
jgi:hypothetical protein